MQIPPGFIVVFARFRNAVGHRCQSAVGYEVNDVLDGTDAGQISSHLSGPYRAQLNSGGAFDGVHILIGNDGDPGVLDSVTGAGVGARSLALSPPQVNGLIFKHTPLGGRHNRGRLYVPDMAESQIDDSGNCNVTAVGLLIDIAAAWLSIPGAVTSGKVVNTRLMHNNSLTPTSITEMGAVVKCATLRRRYPRS